MKRFIVEFGSSADLHGQDPTKAVARAVRDAISHCSLVGLKEVAGITDYNDTMVKVQVALPPGLEEADEKIILDVIPFGTKTLEIVDGGMLASSGLTIEELGDKSDVIVIANACVTVSVPD